MVNREYQREYAKKRRQTEEGKKYHREYMRNTRPLKLTWVNIKSWRVHAKFFDEKKMFNMNNHKYIYKTLNKEQNTILAMKAEEKYLLTKNQWQY